MKLLALGALLAASMAAQSKRVIILLGPPGAGKTTQAKALSRARRIPSISAADLIKKGHGGKSKLSRAVAAPTASGDLVNDETINQLVEFRIQKRDALDGFILDGYPATEAQAKFLAAKLAERGLPAPVVVHLDAPDDVVRARMRGRGRADDKPATIERRLAEFHRERDFVLGFYKGVRRVDATRTEKEVTAQIEKVLAGTG
ncbi:MAG: adenylate kinase family protein [Bryobacteraceae bacterium]